MLPAGCIQDHVSKVATCLQSLFGHFCINFAKWSGAFIGLNWAEIESNLCQEISILSVCFDFPTDVVKKIVITRNKIFQFGIPTSTKAVNQRD